MKILITKNIKEANLITHSGKFHCDEVFATVILSKIIDKIILNRTSNISEVKENQIVYDIGLGEFDHHQSGGNGERANGIQYSSCGLIWKKYGKEVIKKYTKKNVDYIEKLIDRDLIQYIDANDNGQTPHINTDYRFFQLSDVISNFNPNWNEDSDADERFIESVEIANIIFENLLRNTISKVEAKDYVEEAIENINGEIMVLEKFLPWKEFLLESKNKNALKINFVIFPSNRNEYNICAVPKEIKSHEVRKLFPKEWAGLYNEELQKISNIKTATFCHNNRCICSTKTKEDAIKLAEIANKMEEN